MAALDHQRYTPFEALFTLEEGKAGVVVTFMALLELAKEALIEIVQNAPLSPIHVRARLAEPEQVYRPGQTGEAERGEEGGGEGPFETADDTQDPERRSPPLIDAEQE
jgi:segregation and condensation protein A